MNRTVRIAAAAFCLVALTAASRIPLVLNGAQQQQLRSSDTLNLPNVASGTQCVHADSSGNLTGTGTDCGSSSGSLPLVAAVWRLDTGASTATDTNSFAAHGNVFTPDHAITVYAASFQVTTVTGATYKICASPWDWASKKITATPVCSGTWTATAGNVKQDVSGTFTTPLTVSQGSPFATYMVRTDAMGTTSSSNNDTNVGMNPTPEPAFFTQTQSSTGPSAALDLASTSPTTSDTWTVTTTGVWHVESMIYGIN